MGKFNRILQPGFALLIPFIDRIAYVRSLKEAAIEIPSQSAITADNVTLELDGVLYTRVFDAYKARYEARTCTLKCGLLTFCAATV
jgi:regulator of protease activity HflC (stomatin/prohibitin superfamily)